MNILQRTASYLQHHRTRTTVNMFSGQFFWQQRALNAIRTAPKLLSCRNKFFSRPNNVFIIFVSAETTDPGDGRIQYRASNTIKQKLQMLRCNSYDTLHEEMLSDHTYQQWILVKLWYFIAETHDTLCKFEEPFN